MYSYHTQLDKICQTDSRETTVKRRHASRIGVPVGASASRGPRYRRPLLDRVDKGQISDLRLLPAVVVPNVYSMAFDVIYSVIVVWLY